MKDKSFREFELSRAFQLLEPGPVVLVTTADASGNNNIMTLTWHLVMEFTPRIGCIIGPWDYTCEALTKMKECILAIPALDLITKTVQIGNCSGRDTDKFEKFKLTPLKAQKVHAPLIAECLANIECKVIDRIKKYDLFILEAVKAWINDKKKEKRTFHANGDGTFVVDGKTINLKDMMTKWTAYI